MALHIKTDKEFDEALEWLSEHEKTSKTALIRELVLERFQNRKSGFKFGALSHLANRANKTSATVLKKLDEDHDLD